MRARAAVVAAHQHGRTSYPRLRSDPPLTLRTTPVGVHLVGTAAGPLGGDDLELDVRVEPGASLMVRSAAATLAQPGASRQPSSTRTTVAVRTGAALRWEPEPLVLVAGCDHETTTTIDLAGSSTLWWREEVVLGRHGEPSGSAHLRLRVDREGRPLHRSDLLLGPRWPGALGPAGMAGNRAIGTVLAVGPVLPPLHVPTRPGTSAASMVLADDAVLVVAVGDRPSGVRAALDSLAATWESKAP